MTDARIGVPDISPAALYLVGGPTPSPAVPVSTAGDPGPAAVKNGYVRTDLPSWQQGSWVGQGGMGRISIDPGYAPGRVTGPLEGGATGTGALPLTLNTTPGPGTANHQPFMLRAGVLQQVYGYNPPAPGSILPYVARLTGSQGMSNNG